MNVYCKKYFLTTFLFFFLYSINAYSFVVNDINYRIIDKEAKTVGVIQKIISSNNKGYHGSVVIPNHITFNGITYNVTTIEKYAFNNSRLESLYIPNSIVKIKDKAFSECLLKQLYIEDGTTTLSLGAGGWDLRGSSVTRGLFSYCSLETLYLGRNLSYEEPYSEFRQSYSPFDEKTLTNVTIGNSVTDLKRYMFHRCVALKNVTVGNGITDWNLSFSGCTNLTNVKLAYGLKSIGACVFDGCTGLTSIEIPNSVTSIGEWAFEGCTGLTNIEIPNSVTSIGYRAFEGCTGLTNIEITNSVTSIGYSVFRGCTGLTSIEIPNSVTSIGEWAFKGCTGLTNIEIPNSVTSIGNGVFSGCTGLTSIEIPNSVTSIGEYAFAYCKSLSFVLIPNSVTCIGEGAFKGCISLINVTIPNSVTSIGREAFKDCDKLQIVICGGYRPLSTTNDIFSDDIYAKAALYVPKGSGISYARASTWKSFRNIREFNSY